MQSARKRLEAYLVDPENEMNIHDVRTSFRKLEATSSLLPKKMRRRYRGKLEKYRAFLAASSKARDCDIITSRVSTLGDLDMTDLQKRKKTELSKATLIARSLKMLPSVTIAAQDNKRMEKVVKRLIKRIKESLPLVLSDSIRIGELHRLRKEIRKLRYIVETTQTGNGNHYLKKLIKVKGSEMKLKEMQTMLGLIHDSDVTIEYLRKKPNATQILRKEIARRKQLYLRFVRRMKY